MTAWKAELGTSIGARVASTEPVAGGDINDAYRVRFDSSDAIAELLRCCPTQFDPRVVNAFLAVLGKH